MKGVALMSAVATLFLGLGLTLSPAVLADVPGDACSAEGAGGVNGVMRMTCTGGVWVLDALKLGNSSVTCNSGNAGYVRWDGSKFEGCNGSSWIQLAGGGVPTYAGLTTATYTGGAIGGPAGAKAKCDADFPGSRMMKASEAWLYSLSTTIWGWVIADVQDNNSSLLGGGCIGFSNAVGSYVGVAAKGTIVQVTPCTSPLQIHCVID